MSSGLIALLNDLAARTKRAASLDEAGAQAVKASTKVVMVAMTKGDGYRSNDL